MAKLGDSATSGISSENIAMFSASKVRRPYLSASQGQKYRPKIPISSQIWMPLRHSGMVRPKSLMISGVTRAKITPSMPSKPQPRKLAEPMCQCVLVMVPSLLATER